MPELKLKQLQYESNTWKRLLDFMIDENIHLKNRLSEILKDPFDKNLLEEAESFQSSFLKEDQLISLLRNDIAELDQLLQKEVFNDKIIRRKIDIKLNKLRLNINIAQQQFKNLQLAFYYYLSENMNYG